MQGTIIQYIQPFLRKNILSLFFVLLIPVLLHAQHEDTEEEAVSMPPAYWMSREGDTMIGQRNVPDQVINKLKKDGAFWYADGAFPKKRRAIIQDESHIPIAERAWFQTLLWLVILGAFAGVIMWYLSENQVGLFRRKTVNIGQAANEEEQTDIFSINYQNEIDKAIREGNFRVAIRLMYLRLLKDLSERKVISYTQDKTNFDYLMQLSSTRYYPAFFKVTRDYEYAWYGQFDVPEPAFRMIQQDFQQFNRQLN